MNNTVKYILIHLEGLLILAFFVFCIALAESGYFFWALISLCSLFGYCYLVNIMKHIDFVEAYERAWLIKLDKNSK